MYALIIFSFFTFPRQTYAQATVLKRLLRTVVRHNEKGGELAHYLLMSYPKKECSSRSVFNQLSNFLKIIVHVLRTAY